METSYGKFAAEQLGVAPHELDEFDVIDPFNPHNRVEGFLCKRSDHRYGALVILRVNGTYQPAQVIYCTPKLHYPFSTNSAGERIYGWPNNVKTFHVYEKLDGTNICAYSYKNAYGRRCLTFKTRLTPVLRESKFGDFLGMWREFLKRHPEINTLLLPVRTGLCTASFEMYGYRNPHMIVYEEALEARLLFWVSQETHECLPPEQFLTDETGHLCLAPELVNTLPVEGMLTESYAGSRDRAQSINKSAAEDKIIGTEGYVFYVLAGERWHMFKCKPESVEAIHWANDTIPMSIIMPTTWNALESADELTVEVVSELLREEFSHSQVLSSFNRVEKAVDTVLKESLFREKIRVVYESTGMDLKEDRIGTMRALSKHFAKHEMKKVFTALKSLGLT